MCACMCVCWMCMYVGRRWVGRQVSRSVLFLSILSTGVCCCHYCSQHCAIQTIACHHVLSCIKEHYSIVQVPKTWYAIIYDRMRQNRQYTVVYLAYYTVVVLHYRTLYTQIYHKHTTNLLYDTFWYTPAFCVSASSGSTVESGSSVEPLWPDTVKKRLRVWGFRV